MSKNINKYYMYAMIVFSVLVLAYSAWILTSSIQSKIEGNSEGFYFGIIAGVIGIGLAISSFLRLKGRTKSISERERKMLTTVECPNCNVKMLREFKTGDYVNKQVEKCSKCDGQQVITSIFMEKQEKT